MDVAAVTEYLWPSVLERHLRKKISTRLNLKVEEAGKWIAFWVGLHDLGKASPAFQGKWKFGWNSLNADLRKREPPNKSLPHGFLTATFLKELLTEQFTGFPASLADELGRSLGGHHGIFPRSCDLNQINKDQAGGNKWKEVRRDLFQEFVKLCHLDGAALPEGNPGHSFFLLLAGLVSVSDWIGSNSDYFPLAGGNLALEEYSTTVKAKAEKALRKLGWLGWSPQNSFLQMGELFPMVREHGPRPLQQATIKLAEFFTEPGLVILEAPMGEGKTEAAMYLADRWSVALGQKGCYFALPTMATSNQMFSRVKDFLKYRYPDDLINLQLLHGHASLSAEFQALRQRADCFFAPTHMETEDDRVPGRPSGELLAAEWFTHRKRGLLAPYGVGTVDQALLAVLNTKHYFVRLFGLSHKTVIIDEVHAYDAYMVKLLERLLEWLAALGCSVVLLSATLPGERRKALLKAYSQGLGGLSEAFYPQPTSYPRLSWAISSGIGAEHFEASLQFSRSMRIGWVEGSPITNGEALITLGKLLEKALSGGGCAAVICNTVGRAQELYAALKEYFPAQDAGDGWPELDLFHARYLFEGREERERRALMRFGKPGGRVEQGEGTEVEVRRPPRAVLVATQVIEQSLDLDFDLMVTEMAPVDLLLQRAGRLHRHTRPRPDNLREPTLWILEPEKTSPVPAFGKGTEAVYDYHILLRSWLTLKDRQAIAIPAEVEDLIESVYGEGPPPASLPPKVQEAWNQSGGELRRRREKDESQAQLRSILPPYYADDIMEERNAELEEDDPAVHQSLQAATRLGGPSVALIFLYDMEGKPCFDPAGERSAPWEVRPGKATTMALLRRSVAISHRGLTPWFLKNGSIPPGWLKHPLLCRHRLVLLDREHRWHGGGYELQLDPELGAVINPFGKEAP